MRGLDNDVENISDFLTKKQNDFDRVMQLSREIIREAGQTITLLHNDAKKEARYRLDDMRNKVTELQGLDSQFKYNTQQAYQEFAEATIFFEIKTKKTIPARARLKIDEESYLLGLMDVVGELKREILEALRKNDIEIADFYLDTMKNIYDSTRRLRFAEAVLSGFRKKQDVARIQIENAGSEILSFMHRRK